MGVDHILILVGYVVGPAVVVIGLAWGVEKLIDLVMPRGDRRRAARHGG